MQQISWSGRYLFAITLIAFGVIQIITGNFMSAFLPVPESLPGRTILIYLTSAVFIISGLGILMERTTRLSAGVAGVLLFFLLLYPQLFQLIADMHNPNNWTVFGETAALCGGACIIAGAISDRFSRHYGEPGFSNRIIQSGRFFFAFSLFIFGIQHFMYADYIATLIPDWIPFHLFWSYFVGIAFIAASISILIKVKNRLASALLGFMFFFWVIFVHSPRVITTPDKETEWTSLFIALGMCGIFFTLARAPLRHESTVQAGR